LFRLDLGMRGLSRLRVGMETIIEANRLRKRQPGAEEEDSDTPKLAELSTGEPSLTTTELPAEYVQVRSPTSALSELPGDDVEKSDTMKIVVEPVRSRTETMSLSSSTTDSISPLCSTPSRRKTSSLWPWKKSKGSTSTSSSN